MRFKEFEDVVEFYVGLVGVLKAGRVSPHSPLEELVLKMIERLLKRCLERYLILMRLQSSIGRMESMLCFGLDFKFTNEFGLVIA